MCPRLAVVARVAVIVVSMPERSAILILIVRLIAVLVMMDGFRSTIPLDLVGDVEMGFWTKMMERNVMVMIIVLSVVIAVRLMFFLEEAFACCVEMVD